MSALRRAAVLAAAALLLTAGELHACAVCFDARAANRAAFFATTVFLSLLPLGLVGGLAAWLRKRQREVERER